MSLILAGLDGDFRVSLSRNSIKLCVDLILGTYLLYVPLFFEGLKAELTVIDMTSPVLEFMFVQVPWNNTINILFVPYKAIHLGIWLC